MCQQAPPVVEAHAAGLTTRTGLVIGQAVTALWAEPAFQWVRSLAIQQDIDAKMCMHWLQEPASRPLS